MFLIILIIVLGICWYLHAKKGIKWGHWFRDRIYHLLGI